MPEAVQAAEKAGCNAESGITADPSTVCLERSLTGEEWPGLLFQARARLGPGSAVLKVPAQAQQDTERKIAWR